MRRTFFCLVLGSAWLVVASCNGDNSNGDAGDGSTDVIISEPYVPDVAPAAPIITDLVAGAQHTCVLVDYNGRYVTYCFGKGTEIGGTAQGVLATPAADNDASPGFLTLASTYGAGHTCAIDHFKQVWCWGDNTLGQCGQGNMNTPVAAPAIATDVSFGVASASLLTTGSQTTCLVHILDNNFECFGDNSSCEADLYDDSGCSLSPQSATPTTDNMVVFQKVAMLAEGKVHGCLVGVAAGTTNDGGALDGGGDAAPKEGGSDAAALPGIYCYGDNTSLESAPAGTAVATPAVRVAQGNIVSLSAGDSYNCYTTLTHGLYCFGKNDVHQSSPTSTATTIDPTAAVPITLPSSAIAQSVVVRSNESCVIDINGLVWCFGNGHGTNIDQLQGVKDVQKLALGASHQCVLGHLTAAKPTDPVGVICWGTNTAGQAGQTPGTTVATPTAVLLPPSAP